MEKVITISNWWDGPLEGLAYYNGIVCIYERIFDEGLDDYIDEYYLTPVTNNEKDEIISDWQEWCNAVSNNDLESYYKKYLKNRAIDRVINNSKFKRKYRKKAKFSGRFENGYIPVDYYAEWYD
jgi:hypothetical protein